jgi:predicted RNase H-like HicB family nuclease
MTQYVVLIDGEPGAYGVTVPDLPGAVGAGSTIDEALASASDGVRLWIAAMTEEGTAIPQPRPIEVLRRDSDFAVALRDGALLASVPA